MYRRTFTLFRTRSLNGKEIQFWRDDGRSQTIIQRGDYTQKASIEHLNRLACASFDIIEPRPLCTLVGRYMDAERTTMRRQLVIPSDVWRRFYTPNSQATGRYIPLSGCHVINEVFFWDVPQAIGHF